MYSNVKYKDTFLTGRKTKNQTNIRNLSVERNWGGDFGCDPAVWRVGTLGSPRLCSLAVTANMGTKHQAAAQPGKLDLSSPPLLRVN